MLASPPAMAPEMLADVSYAAPQAPEIIDVALHWKYSLFIFSQGKKDLYHI
jgi:hypothetical protein